MGTLYTDWETLKTRSYGAGTGRIIGLGNAWQLCPFANLGIKGITLLKGLPPHIRTGAPPPTDI